MTHAEEGLGREIQYRSEEVPLAGMKMTGLKEMINAVCEFGDRLGPLANRINILSIRLVGCEPDNSDKTSDRPVGTSDDHYACLQGGVDSFDRSYNALLSAVERIEELI